MDQQGSSVRKAYEYKLKPSPQQECELERVLVLCRHLYNAALASGARRGVTVTYYQQKSAAPADRFPP